MTTKLTQSDCPGSKLVFWGAVRPSCAPMPASGAGGGISLVLLQTLPPPKPAWKISHVLKTLSQLLPHLCSPQRAEELSTQGWAWGYLGQTGALGLPWGGHGATWGHLAQARALELAHARLWQPPWPHSQPRHGTGEAAGEAARYSWKPGGEVMLPECCNLRPDERGQLCLERSLSSAARAVCRSGGRLCSQQEKKDF